jgi:filamentous hemagglutinin family protein
MKRHASLNRMYRLVWSRVQNAWIAVSEITKGQGKSGRSKTALKRKAIVAALALAFTPLAHANPIGAQVVSGTASITQSGNLLTITNSPNAILNWQSFSIGSNETTSFIQQSASSSVLNRVVTNNPSSLLGSLISNGKVYLVNPAGILVGAGAKIDVAGLVATTLNISNADFQKGKLNFTATPNAGAVSNSGTITTPDGGSVYLVAPQVQNSGIITTPQGETLLAAGNTVTLVDTGTPGVSVQVTGSATTATNLGQIIADTGRIGVVGAVVNNSGTLNADSIVSQGGRVFLQASHSITAGGTISAEGIGGGSVEVLADMQQGSVNVAGTLDASAPNGGDGGFIETSAASVNIANTAKVTTSAALGLAGSWLIDPTDFVIAAAGGNITGATLSTELGAGDVSIASGGSPGDIHVDDTVIWSAHQLTLSANDNIYINTSMNGSGTASLVLQYGQGAAAAGNTANYFFGNGAQINLPAGNNFHTLLGSDGSPVSYTVITALGAAGDATVAPSTMTLQGMAATSSLAGNYVLGANIDATATSAWNSGAGFTPIGNAATHFTGIFDGLGHSISNLTINLPTAYYVGLFGYTDTGSVIQNVGLSGGSVSGANYVGGLAGYSAGAVSNSYATGSVSGSVDVGGLVGYNTGAINASYATGNVTGTGSNVGGLSGYNYGTINSSYATGNVGGTGSNVGGLVGNNYGSGSSYGTINNSYASGRVSGASYVGGLVGDNNGGIINNSYAIGSVSGAGNSVGGLVGNNAATGAINGSFWNSDVNATGIGVDNNSSVTTATGLSSIDMQQSANFSGWDFSNTWVMYDGYTNPLLLTFITPITVTANNASVTYDKVAYSGGNGVTYSYTPGGTLSGTVSYSGSSQGALNAGSYAIAASGLYSYSQHGYLISYANGALTINPAPLTVAGTTVADKTYDGTTTATLSGGSLSGVYSGDSVTLVQAGNFVSKHVGSGNGVISADSLSGISADNYAIVQPTGLSASITPLAITVAATGADRVYDGTVNDAATLASLGIVSGDAVSLADASATFADKNAGTGKTVTVIGITMSGADAGNYTLTNTSATTTANITPKAITVAATGTNKVYDGTITDAVAISSRGILSGDVLTFSDTSTFADKNIGTAKPVSVTGIAISGGADAGNYTLNNTSATTTANITPKTITVNATSGNMVYSGLTTDTAAITLSITGLVTGDSVSVADALATFSNKNAGANRGVTVSGITMSGADAGNYVLASTRALTTANITPLSITVSATGNNIVYDGKTKDTVTLASSGIISGDLVKFSDTSATFSDKNVGTGKTVTVTGIKATGAQAKDYTIIDTTTTTTANITPKTITVTAKGSNMVYDGSANDSVTLSAKGLISGDALTFSDTSATFASKNVITSGTVTVTGITASGTNMADYSYNTTATTKANITPLKITNLTASVSITGSVISSPTFSSTLALVEAEITDGLLSFTDTSVTESKSGVVTVKGIALSGTDAADFKLSSTTLTASVTP